MLYNAGMSEKITCGHMHNIMLHFRFNESSRDKFSYYTRVPEYDNVSISVHTGCKHPNDILGYKSTKITVDGVIEVISGVPKVGEIKYIGRTGGTSGAELLESLAKRVNEAKVFIQDNLAKKPCSECGGTVSVRDGCYNNSCPSKIQVKKTYAFKTVSIMHEKEGKDMASPRQKNALMNFSRSFEANGIKKYSLAREIIESMTHEQAHAMLASMSKEWETTIKGRISPGQKSYLKSMMNYLRSKRFKTDIIPDADIDMLTFEEANKVINKIKPKHDELREKDAAAQGAVKRLRRSEQTQEIMNLFQEVSDKEFF